MKNFIAGLVIAAAALPALALLSGCAAVPANPTTPGFPLKGAGSKTTATAPPTPPYVAYFDIKNNTGTPILPVWESPKCWALSRNPAKLIASGETTYPPFDIQFSYGVCPNGGPEFRLPIDSVTSPATGCTLSVALSIGPNDEQADGPYTFVTDNTTLTCTLHQTNVGNLSVEEVDVNP